MRPQKRLTSPVRVVVTVTLKNCPTLELRTLLSITSSRPYSDVRLLPYLQHSFWFLPNVAACYAMANLLAEKHNTFWHGYTVVVAAGAAAGVGLEALPPVRKVIPSPHCLSRFR